MLVGTIPEVGQVVSNSKTVEALKEYSLTLIPDTYKNTSEIVNNQLYLCASMLLSSNVSYDVKKEIAGTILNESYVTGCLNTCVELAILDSLIDKEKLNNYINKLKREIAFKR